MKQFLSGLAVLVATLPLLPAPAEASAMRCGIHVIQGGGRHGPTKYEVMKKCGKPSSQRSELWIYRINGVTWELRFDGANILTTIRQVR